MEIDYPDKKNHTDSRATCPVECEHYSIGTRPVECENYSMGTCPVECEHYSMGALPSIHEVNNVSKQTKEIYPVKCEAYFTGTKQTKQTKQTRETRETSAAELQSHMYVALDQDYVVKETFDNIYGQADKTAKMISRLITYLRENERRFKQGKRGKPDKQ